MLCGAAVLGVLCQCAIVLGGWRENDIGPRVTLSHPRGVLTVTLTAKGDHRLSTKIKLTFTPSKGRSLTAAVAAKFKR